MRNQSIVTGVMVMALVIILYPVTAKSAQQSPAQFYQGKTITWISSTAPGQGGDMMTRLIAPFLAKETGAKVKYENMGTEEGVNWVYTKGSKDGLTVVSKISNAVIANDLLKAPGVQYEAHKFFYITNFDPGAWIFAVSPKSKFRTLDDLRRAKGFKAGATSLKGALASAAAVVFEILGVDGKVITGYKGSSDALSAVMKDEVESIVLRGSSVTSEVKSGYLLPLFALPDEGCEAFENLPSMREFGAKVPKELEDACDFVSSSGTMLAMPPGVPQDRVDYMREVFDRLSKNANLKATLTKIGVGTGVWNGKKTQEYMTRLKNNKALGAQLEALLAKYSAVR